MKSWKHAENWVTRPREIAKRNESGLDLLPDGPDSFGTHQNLPALSISQVRRLFAGSIIPQTLEILH